jgi:hypothetical protein
MSELTSISLERLAQPLLNNKIAISKNLRILFVMSLLKLLEPNYISTALARKGNFHILPAKSSGVLFL